MNQTPNYQLNQWDAGDRVLRTDFNADNAKIDEALGKKAEAAALTALTQTVNSHTATLSKKGNCRIWTTTYTGDGTYGNDNPTVINFPGKPLFAMIFNMRTSNYMPLAHGMKDASAGGLMSNTYCEITWVGNTAKLVNTQVGYRQMNDLGVPYFVVAMIAAD